MATFHHFENISRIYYKLGFRKAAVAVRQGTVLVWQAIKSCFGAGYWRNDAPWDNNDAWV